MSGAYFLRVGVVDVQKYRRDVQALVSREIREYPNGCVLFVSHNVDEVGHALLQPAADLPATQAWLLVCSSRRELERIAAAQ
jgi:hypothetical protein